VRGGRGCGWRGLAAAVIFLLLVREFAVLRQMEAEAAAQRDAEKTPAAPSFEAAGTA